MNVYFDIGNFRSLAKACSHQDFMSCVNMLGKNFNIHFNFSKELLDKEKKQSLLYIRTLLKHLTHNRGNSEPFIWNDSFPPRPLSKDIYDCMTNKQLTSLYLINDENVEMMTKQGCLLFASEGNEIKAIQNLFIEGDCVPTKQYPIRKMNNWETIEKNASPCTDIIIVDRYIFSQEELFYEFNSFKIIEHLARFNNYKINVVIFTSKDNQFSSISRKLREKLGEKLYLTFVVIPEGQGKEHDRTIITNYKMFVSGDSFTYFDNKGKNLSRGRWLYVNSHGDFENREDTLQYLKDLQLLVDERKSGICSIIGDKKSCLLKF